MSTTTVSPTIRAAIEAKAADLREGAIYDMGTEASELTAVALTAAGLPILTPKGPTPIEDAVWRRVRTAGADAALRAMVEEAIAALEAER
jgi:hypothetical protein